MSEVVQLICYDVVFSQEGILLVLVLEKGETNLSSYLLNTKSEFGAVSVKFYFVLYTSAIYVDLRPTENKVKN